MIRSLTAGVLVVGMMAGGTVWAQGPRGGGPRRAVGAEGRGAGPGLPMAGITLTQTQQDVIRDIRERGSEEIRQIQTRMQAEILSVLTPAQQEQVKRTQAEREQRRQEAAARRSQQQ